MAQDNHDKLITNLALMAGAYLLVLKPIFEKLGLKDDPKLLETEKRKKDLLNDYVNEAIKKQKPTKSDAEWQMIADQIYADLRYSAASDDKDDAGYQVSRPQNDADMALLIKYFAKRQEYLFGINAGGLMNLSQFIRSNLSNKAIATIHDNYSRKGIKFRF